MDFVTKHLLFASFQRRGLDRWGHRLVWGLMSRGTVASADGPCGFLQRTGTRWTWKQPYPCCGTVWYKWSSGRCSSFPGSLFFPFFFIFFPICLFYFLSWFNASLPQFGDIKGFPHFLNILQQTNDKFGVEQRSLIITCEPFHFQITVFASCFSHVTTKFVNWNLNIQYVWCSLCNMST